MIAGYRQSFEKLILLGLAPCLGVVAVHASESTAAAGRGDADFAEMSLEELGTVKVPMVYGASKFNQKITEAPASVSIITKDDFKKQGYRTLSQALGGVRGFFTINDRAYEYLGVRGVNRLGDYGGRTLITINGHRVNEPLYDSAFIGTEFPLDVDLIERVEVIRGPGSSLYGNNAFFGVINVVTRDPEDFRGNGVEISGSYGDFDEYTGRFSYGNRFKNGASLLLSGSFLQSDGEHNLEYPANPAAGFPGAIERENDGSEVSKIFAALSYNGLTLEGLYGRRLKELPNGPYLAVFNDGRNWMWDESAYLEARFERDLGNDWGLMVRAYGDHYAYEGSYIYDYQDPANPNLTENRDAPEAVWWGAELQLSKVLWEKHRLTFGAEGRHDPMRAQKNFDLDPHFTYIDIEGSQKSAGAYFQDEFRILDTLVLNAGVRSDYFDSFGGTVNPRAGLIYQPWDATTFKALYGQAYRAPNAYELDFENLFYKGNKDLSPEQIQSYELVWEQSIARHYRLTGSLFYNHVTDLITQRIDPGDGRIVFQNTDAVDIRGAEIEAEAQWENGVRLRASYSYAQAEDRATGTRPPNSPKGLAKLQATSPLYHDKIFASIELLATSRRGTLAGESLPGHWLVNATLFSQELLKNLELSAGVYNLFDKRYFDPAAPDFMQDINPQPGRTFRIKATYAF